MKGWIPFLLTDDTVRTFTLFQGPKTHLHITRLFIVRVYTYYTRRIRREDDGRNMKIGIRYRPISTNILYLLLRDFQTEITELIVSFVIPKRNKI